MAIAFKELIVAHLPGAEDEKHPDDYYKQADTKQRAL